MNPTLVAIVSLGFATLVQTAAACFFMGGLANRVRQLENADRERIDLKPAMARLEATVTALGERMTEFKSDNHESFRELNHIIRNRLMIAQGKE